MAKFRFNEPNLNEVLRGHSGPVYRLVSEYAQLAEIHAKYEAPVDSGELAQSISHVPPYTDGRSLRTRIKVGARHGMVVHQGRGAIRPVNKKYLSYYWKRIGRKTNPFTDKFAYYVQPRAGRPFLIEGLEDADDLSPANWKIIVKRPWRTDGS